MTQKEDHFSDSSTETIISTDFYMMKTKPDQSNCRLDHRMNVCAIILYSHLEQNVNQANSI